MPTAYSWTLVEGSALSGSPPASSPSLAGESLPRDFLLAPDGEELEVVDGDLVLASGLDAVAQDVDLALRLVQGEWFLDEDAGTPYWDVIWRKAPNLAVVRAVLTDRIESRAAIQRVESFDMTFAQRELSVSFGASTDFGALNTAVTLGGV